MLRNNLKIRLPWVGKLEDEHFVIRDTFDRVVAIVPTQLKNQYRVGNYILRVANNRAIKDKTLDKIENIALIFGLVIVLLTTVTILVDIDYSPMLILGGGILTTLAYMQVTRAKAKS